MKKVKYNGVYLFKILFMTIGNSLIKGPRSGKKSQIGFKSNLF